MTLENEPTTDTTADPTTESAPAQSAPPRRRRAAKRAAGPPAVEPEPDGGPAAGPDGEPAAEAPAPAKRAPRKRAAKKTAAPAEAPAGEQAAETPAAEMGETAPAAPAKKTTRKRAAKKATAPEPAAEQPAETPVEDETEQSEPAEETAAAAPAPATAVLFQAPDPAQAAPPRRRRAASRPAGPPQPHAEDTPPVEAGGSPSDSSAGTRQAKETQQQETQQQESQQQESQQQGDDEQRDDEGSGGGRRRRRRGGRGRRRRGEGDSDEAQSTEDAQDGQRASSDDSGEESGDQGEGQGTDEESGEEGTSSKRRRRRRRRGGGDGDVEPSPDDPPNTVVKVRKPRKVEDDVTALKGSTRLEAKRQRRREGRESGRRRQVITEAEFLARRESVERVMVVRERDGRTQIAVLEDGLLVEHYVARKTQTSMIGNVYLGKVQNVLPSMEAAFVDVGKGRNAVLYAGEVNWDAAGLEGQPKRIEVALKSGDPVLVQVTKDPIGHKGARLTSQVSLPGRYLVYVPGSSMTGISRKLPDTERNRLKKILKSVLPEDAGVIVRTAAEGASEEELARDVERLKAQWEDIEKKSKAVNPPTMLYGEPDLTVKVVRDVFNEDFTKLVVAGDEAWDTVHEYVSWVAPDLTERLERWDGEKDVFAAHRVDEQISKALERKVWLPSGGSLVIDRTEAMTVVDVNTGKFTGSGGNLEETVTKNNLEAAEEIVRQLRLRDIGGIIVVDFIDMVLESNRDLVLRRLLECLGRDRTKHQVAEVTSLGLVQMTRKRVGQGLLEAFSETCEHCGGRGVVLNEEPVEPRKGNGGSGSAGGSGGNGDKGDKADKGDAKRRSGAKAVHEAATRRRGQSGDGKAAADAPEAESVEPAQPTAEPAAADAPDGASSEQAQPDQPTTDQPTDQPV